MEVPYFEDSGAILDNPPVFPDVNFIPYKGNSQNISFFITSGIGKVTDNPIIFNTEEQEYYSLWRESRKYNDLEPILYISDETQNLGASFEILGWIILLKLFRLCKPELTLPNCIREF